MAEHCLICKRELDVAGDLGSTNCGGDCMRCMASLGDEDCAKALAVKATWQLVVYSSECNGDGDCPFCGIDYGDCPCPGPHQDDEYEYEEVAGTLYARKIGGGDAD